MGSPQKQNAEQLRCRLDHDIGLRLAKLLNILLVTVPFALCWYGYYEHNVVMSPSVEKNVGIIIAFVALYLFFGRI